MELKVHEPSDRQKVWASTLTHVLGPNSRHKITTKEDLARVWRKDIAHVHKVLAYIRRPEVARHWGFTVPYLTRGSGIRRWHLLDVDRLSTDQEISQQVKGEISHGKAEITRHRRAAEQWRIRGDQPGITAYERKRCIRQSEIQAGRAAEQEQHLEELKAAQGRKRGKAS